MPAVQFAHALHSLSFDITENCPALHSAHTRSVPLVPSVATNFPPKQLLQSVHAAADRGENVPAPHAMQVLSLVAVPSLDEVPLTATKLPAVQLRHCEQAPWLDPVEKVCGPHEEHARSEVEDPAALTKLPPPQTVQGVHLGLGGRLDSDTLPK